MAITNQTRVKFFDKLHKQFTQTYKVTHSTGCLSIQNEERNIKSNFFSDYIFGDFQNHLISDNTFKIRKHAAPKHCCNVIHEVSSRLVLGYFNILCFPPTKIQQSCRPGIHSSVIRMSCIRYFNPAHFIEIERDIFATAIFFFRRFMKGSCQILTNTG